jgi:hypothetical protein
MTETTVIEICEGHEVTSSALDVNIGSGLREAMRIAPEIFRHGEVFDIVARVQVKRVAHEPSNTDKKTKEVDYEGPYTRIHVCTAIAAAPVVGDDSGAKAVRKLLDKHSAAVAHHRELEGQGVLLNEDDSNDEDDEALADKEARLAKQEADDFYDSAKGGADA